MELLRLHPRGFSVEQPENRSSRVASASGVGEGCSLVPHRAGGLARQPRALVSSNGCCLVSIPDTRRSPMRTWTKAAALALMFSTTATGNTQAPAPQHGDAKLPAPGTRGNADNVPYIGKSDAKGNPVRLARTTGHVSNYTEEKVPAYTLPDPLVLANGQRVTSAE